MGWRDGVGRPGAAPAPTLEIIERPAPCGPTGCECRGKGLARVAPRVPTGSLCLQRRRLQLHLLLAADAGGAAHLPAGGEHLHARLRVLAQPAALPGGVPPPGHLRCSLWDALPRCPALHRAYCPRLFCPQLVDTPGLIPGFNLSEALGDQSGTLNFSQIYRCIGCLRAPMGPPGCRGAPGKERGAHPGEDTLLGGLALACPVLSPVSVPQAVPAGHCPVADAAPGPEGVPGRAFEHQPGGCLGGGEPCRAVPPT